MNLLTLVMIAFAVLYLFPSLFKSEERHFEVRAQLVPNESNTGLVYTGTRDYA